MNRPLTKILQSWLEHNEGWWNKAVLTRMEWKYDDSYRLYSPDTVGRKLREATEDEMILSRQNNRGQTEYSGKIVRKIEKYEYDPINRVMKMV